MKYRLLYTILGVCILSLSCQKEVSVSSVSLNEKSIALIEGETKQLRATISPADATNQSLSWTSSNTSVATVSDGLVVAIKEGTTTITVKSLDGGKSASCSVSVSPKYVAVNSIALDKTSITLYDDEEVTLTATITPENSTEKTITWRSSDESVATVSGGKVTAHKEGSTEVTASIENVSAKCVVTVQKRIIHVESIGLSVSQKRLKVGESFSIECSVYPSNANDYELTYKSDDESIARVSNDGVVTAISSGKTTINVTAEGISANVSISVFETDDIYYSYSDYNYKYYTSWVYNNDNLLYEEKELVINYMFIDNDYLLYVGTEFPWTRAVAIENGVKRILNDSDGNRTIIDACTYANHVLYYCATYSGGHGIWVNNEKKYDLEAISEYSYLNVHDMTVVGNDVYTCGAITEPVDANTKKTIPVIWKNGIIYHRLELDKNSTFDRITSVNNKIYFLLREDGYVAYKDYTDDISIWDENGKCYDLGESYYASGGKIYSFNSTLYSAKVNYDDKTDNSLLTVFEGDKILFEIEDVEVGNYELDYVDGDIYCLVTRRTKIGGDFYYSVLLYRNGVEEKVIAKTQRNPMYARGIKVFAKN